MTFRIAAILWLALCGLLCAEGFDIIVVPSSNQLLPLLKVSSILEERGHRTRIFVPSKSSHLCRHVMRSASACVAYSAAYKEASNDLIASGLSGIGDAISDFIPDALVVSDPKPAAGVGRYPGIPTVLYWEYSLESIISSCSFKKSTSSSIAATLHSFAFAKPICSFTHVLTPAIDGQESRNPESPTIHHVGLISSPLEDGAALPTHLKTWMDACTNGIVLFTIGLDNYHASGAAEEAVRSVSVLGQMCVLWEMRGVLRMKSPTSTDSFVTATYSESSLSALNSKILRHRFVKAFVAHCRVQDLYDSIEAGVPIVIMPTPSDDLSICSLVPQKQIGILVREDNTQKLVDSVLRVVNNFTMEENLLYLSRKGYIMGCAQKAADVIELAAAEGPLRLESAREDSYLFSPISLSGFIALALFFLIKRRL